MLIDWVTVAAQVVNFLILVAILRFFLYDRIVAVMNRRRDAITAAFTQAGERERAAAAAEAAHATEVRRLQVEHQGRLDEMEAEVAATRRRLLTELREEIATLRGQWQIGLTEERGRLLDGIQVRVGEAVEDVARRALTSLAGVSLEERMIEAFLDRLSGAGEMAEAFGERIEVVTSFATGPEMRHRIQEALQRHLGEGRQYRFRRDRRLACGIELRSGGRSLGWSLDHYLNAIRDGFDEKLDEELGLYTPEPAAGGAPGYRHG